MGKLVNGIQGPFIGKVGPVVGSMWMGKAVMRGVPKKRTKPFSPGEIQQHEKFRLMNNFLGPVMDMLNRSFKPVAFQMSGYNKGFSYNVKNVITGSYPGLAIDYSMVLLGRGDLPNAASPKVSVNIKGQLEFSWADNSGRGIARETDMVYVAAYNREPNHWRTGMDLATRRAGFCTLDVTKMDGRPLHTYIGFMSADGRNGTDTVYLGEVSNYLSEG